MSRMIRNSSKILFLITKAKYWIFLSIILSSCSATKFVEEGNTLYTGSEINISDKQNIYSKRKLYPDLDEIIAPDPNTKILGSRPALWIHYKTVDHKDKGINKWLNEKLGKKPVLMENVPYENLAQMLSRKLENEGYFSNEVDYEILKEKKTASLRFNITLGKYFRYRDFHYPNDSSVLIQSIEKKNPESKLKPKQRYDLNKITEERARIEKELKNEGFYYFDDSYILYEADTTVGDHQIDMYLTIKDNLPDKINETYKIRDIYISPSSNVMASDIKADTIKVDSVYFIKTNDEFKPGALIENVNFRPNDLYTHTAYEYTLNKLVGLNLFRYVNINFMETDKKGYLDTKIKLAPYKEHSIRFELQGVTKSNGFTGPFFNATYSNKNLFGGAERLDVTMRTGFETQINREEDQPLYSYELGMETALTFPEFITPFGFDNRSSRYIPNTVARLGASRTNRVGFFTMNSFDTEWGYEWTETQTKSHELYPAKINVVHLSHTTNDFESLVESNSLIRKSYEEQFILGSRYSYYFNSQASPESEGDDFYFNGNINLSGNIAYLIQDRLSATEHSYDSPYKIGGASYSQYTKADVDVRYYFPVSSDSKMAMRLIAGAAYPYGNSNTVPYVQQFSVGGANSLRAFAPRSIGPGTYRTESGILDQTSEIKIEYNLEYRFTIAGALKGATFIDIGNIWAFYEDADRPGVDPNENSREGIKFEWGDFMSEMAIGTGFGFRYDLDYFVIRLDLGYPLRRPDLAEYYSNQENEDYNPSKANDWVFDKLVWDKNEPDNAKEINDNYQFSLSDIKFNIGIGYPF